MTLPEYDLVTVGAGFAGMYTTIHAVRRGLRVIGIEAGADVGGTWYWNRYPGARCDVESIDYSYSFDTELEKEWRWSERYATQPEILQYLSHVADRFDVRPHYRFDERVTAATWNEDKHLWDIHTSSGYTTTSRWVVMATGGLSAPVLPNIPGRDSYDGVVLQTSSWPESPVDFTGKRVAVIGTGSSGIQVVPKIAESAETLTVFQRSANYSVPAFNRMLDDNEWQRQQAGLLDRRATSWKAASGSPWTSYPTPYSEVSDTEREEVFEDSWTQGGVLFAKAFQGLTVDPEINNSAREFFERKLAKKVRDPQVLADLTPTDHAFGTKRICTDTGYYESFNLPGVSLVNLRRDPIVEIEPTGIRTESGLREFDIIVYATGFDAMTGALKAIDVRGRDGRSIREAWSGFPQTYLGVGLPGFPNLLVLNGPGTPAVLANMALTSEQQGEFALRMIDYCTADGITSAEARQDAAEAWTRHGQELADATLFGDAPSWYNGANIDGKARGFLPYIGGFHTYCTHANDVAKEGYRGFVLSRR